MSPKPKGNESTRPPTAPAQVLGTPPEAPVGSASRDEGMRLRAYEIYLERGERPGSELDDWLQAERELQGEPLSRAQAG
jgi:hypothetical protein